MMGRTHGISGIVTGLGLGAAMGATPLECGLLAAVSFVGAYLPDLDHRQSTVTRSVPVLGRIASFVARRASRMAYAATKGPRDEPWTGEHRHLTHTAVAAAAIGGLIGLATYFTADRFGVADPLHLSWLVGLGMAVGCLTHCLGDSLTLMGCPWLWPLPIAGETWAELRPPRCLRFRTGGRVERLIVLPTLVVAAFLLIPGVWPTVLPLITTYLH